VVEVNDRTSRLLEEPGDMLHVGWEDGPVKALLCCGCVTSRGKEAEALFPLFLCLVDVLLDAHITAAIVVRDSNDMARRV
jgi:hypothetical protein